MIVVSYFVTCGLLMAFTLVFVVYFRDASVVPLSESLRSMVRRKGTDRE